MNTKILLISLVCICGAGVSHGMDKSVVFEDTFLVTRAHVYDGCYSGAIGFRFDIPMKDGVDLSGIRNKLKLPEEANLGQVLTLSIQPLEYAWNPKAPNQEISLKPQWNYCKGVPDAPNASYNIGSNVACKTLVLDSSGLENLRDHGSGYPHFHPAGQGVMACSPDIFHLGFTGVEDRSRAIFYHETFANGTGAGAELNGQCKTGLICLYSAADFEASYERITDAQLLKYTLGNTLNELPLIKDNATMRSLLGLNK